MSSEVLLTCPPMIQRIEHYKSALEKHGIKIHIPTMRQKLGEEELVALVPRFDGWIVGDDPATDKVLRAGKRGRMKACVKWGIGTDNVDLEACRGLGLPVTNIPNVFGEEVSDVAVGYLLCLARHLHLIHVQNLVCQWTKPVGKSLSGKKCCLIGHGNVGACIARKLQVFRLRVFVSDPVFCADLRPEGSLLDGHAPSFAPLAECLSDADFVVVSCPLNAQTRGMINRDTLLMTRRGVIVINVARGPIVVERDVVELLDAGHVSSVGFDVFEEEPLAVDNPLRRFPQNIFGSHNGSNTAEAVDHVSALAITRMAEMLQEATVS
jgi:D-3-phosphoglycerate dehydrogenase